MLVLVLADAYFKCVIKRGVVLPCLLAVDGWIFFFCLLFVVFTVLISFTNH